jgi:hypothetical protein
VRWETPASVLLSLSTPNQPPGFRPQDDLSCFFRPTIPARPAKKRHVHTEHEMLIFLYFGEHDNLLLLTLASGDR